MKALRSLKALGWTQGVRWRGAPPADDDALALAMAMVAVPVVLGFVGLLVDGWLDTNPLFVILFAAVGVVGSFATAFYRYERRIAEHDEGKPWTRSARKALG